MKRQSLYFLAPREVEVREDSLEKPGPGEIQLRALCSAISAGSELLLYRGEAPTELPADDILPALSGSLAYPLKYGYANIGRVTALGKEVDEAWKGRRVFAFNPHETAFNAHIKDVQIVPEECADEDAVFLANAETALNLILDANPRIGERVVVLGQGVVGLLTTSILARHPLDALLSFDLHPNRRALSAEVGAQSSFDPKEAAALALAKERLGSRGADLVIELSGHPQSLDLALDLIGEEGRILIGSWYGLRRAEVNLGMRFHRGRIKLISSQVSSIAPELTGRWDRQRRFDLAWKLLAEIRPSRFVSQRMPLQEAARAYELLETNSAETTAVLFKY